MNLYADPLAVRGSSKVECHYSDWSSCSHFCGERAKGWCSSMPIPKSQELCVSYERSKLWKHDMHRLQNTGKRNFCPQDPFVFGDWKETELCSETCGKEGKFLLQRTCTPTHSDKSCANLPPSKTLKLGNETCEREPCKGNWYWLKTNHHRSFQPMDGLVKLHGQLQWRSKSCI